jgi:ParB-like chromosome segregation protein Spo0J
VDLKKKIDELRVKPEYARYAYELFPLRKQEYDSLKADITANNGMIHLPLSINKEGIILDGHHRFKIGREIGITEYPVIVKEFENSLEELAYVLRINALGRQIMTFKRER